MSGKTEKVTFQHFRLPASSDWPTKGEPDTRQLYPYQPGVTRFEPHPRGGATICTIENGHGTFTGVTLASMSQNFTYEDGRNKAKRRARMQQQLAERQDKDFFTLYLSNK